MEGVAGSMSLLNQLSVCVLGHRGNGLSYRPEVWTSMVALVLTSLLKPISHSSQCSTTGVTKALVCLFYGAYKRTLAANWKE